MPPNLLFTDGDYTLATSESPIRRIADFAKRGDLGVNLFEQDFYQFIEDYAPIPLDTPHPTIADAILVEDGTNLRVDQVAEVAHWTRVYAVIPNSRKEYSSFSWTVPGLDKGGSNPIILISSITNPVAGLITVNTAAAHGLIAGDRFFFYYQNPQSIYKPASFNAGVVDSVVSATAFKIASYSNALVLNDTYAVQKAEAGRRPRTKVVPSYVLFEYFYSTDPLIDIPILLTPVVVDSTLQEVSPPLYSGFTDPTSADYIAQITAKDPIVAQDSIVTRWKGNIYERATRYVIAQ